MSDLTDFYEYYHELYAIAHQTGEHKEDEEEVRAEFMDKHDLTEDQLQRAIESM